MLINLRVTAHLSHAVTLEHGWGLPSVLGSGRPLFFDGGFDFRAQSGHLELAWIMRFMMEL